MYRNRENMDSHKHLIGIGYTDRCGKDTAAEFLAKHYGFVNIKLGDTLRRVIDPIVSPLGLNPFLESFKDEVLNCNLTGRGLLVETARFLEATMGPSWLPISTLNRTMWIHERVVVSDVRSTIQAQEILNRGGYMLVIHRRGCYKQYSDAFVNGQYVIDNNGTMAELYRQVSVLPFLPPPVVALDSPADAH